MGELFAIFSMTLFSFANIMINRGAEKGARSRGAFLSIIISAVVASILWFGVGLVQGFPTINSTAVLWFSLGGLLTMIVGRVFLYASIQSIGAIRASAVKRLNPVFSVILGVVLLNEAISGRMAFGMVLIFASFAILVHQTFRQNARSADHSALQHVAALGYLYGPVSALAYALGYVTRKQGLIAMPDPVFGTMVGAWVGLAGFLVVSAIIPSFKNDVRKTFSSFNLWLLLAGLAGTFGQICYFVALQYIAVSKIALITSMEVFLTIFLSVIVFRHREGLSRDVVIAAGLGIAGTASIILSN